MVDGLIFTKALQKSQFEEYLASRIPIVVVDRNVEAESEKIGRVFIDTKSAIFDSTSYLLDKGCRTIAFISAVRGNVLDRYDGYCEALQKHGLSVDEELVHCGDYDVETGYTGTKKILSGHRTVDGIVCGNDLIAVGAINAAQERGIRIPEELKLIGMDDIYFSRFLSPPLTTINQPAYEMGRVAAKMLIDHILDDAPLFSKELQYELIVRNSV